MNTDITSPTHYTLGIETRQYIMSWNMDFASGNVVKYVTRAPHKGQRLSDLRKAAQYLGWLIEVATDEEQELRDASREAEYGKGPGRKEGGM